MSSAASQRGAARFCVKLQFVGPFGARSAGFPLEGKLAFARYEQMTDEVVSQIDKKTNSASQITSSDLAMLGHLPLKGKALAAVCTPQQSDKLQFNFAVCAKKDSLG